MIDDFQFNELEQRLRDEAARVRMQRIKPADVTQLFQVHRQRRERRRVAVLVCCAAALIAMLGVLRPIEVERPRNRGDGKFVATTNHEELKGQTLESAVRTAMSPKEVE